MRNKRLFEKRLKRGEVFSGRAVNFRADSVLLPGGKAAVREFMDHPGAVAVLPVPWKLSLKAAAAALGLSKVAMADQGAAERATGYVLGGISPLGQRKRLPTVVDSSALSFDRMLCSAGKRGWDVALAPQDLVRLTHAVTADIRAV